MSSLAFVETEAEQCSINPETADILGPGRFESSDWQEELTPLPTTFNTVLTAAHVLRAEVRAPLHSRFPLTGSELQPPCYCHLSLGSCVILCIARQ